MNKKGLPLFGLYSQSGSWLHRIDARVKLLLGFLLVVAALFSRSLLFQGGVSLLLLAAILTLRLDIGSLFRLAVPLLIMVALTMLFHLVFVRGEGDVMVSLYGFEVSRGSFMAGLLYSLRVVLFYLSAYLIMATVSPSEMVDALSQTFRPLKGIGIPVQDLSLILFMAIRFIPLIYDEFFTIKRAQQVRGVTFAGSLPSRVRQVSALLSPLLINATQRADETALALRARGYTTAGRRTNYAERAMSGSDWLYLFAGMLVLVTFFLTTYSHADA